MQSSSSIAATIQVKNENNKQKRVAVDIAVGLPLEAVPPNLEASPKKHGVGVIDTGAEITLVCARLLDDLNALPMGIVNILGINGQPREANTYLVNVEFIHDESISFCAKNLTVAALDNSNSLQVLLGMDILTEHFAEFSLRGNQAKITYKE